MKSHCCCKTHSNLEFKSTKYHSFTLESHFIIDFLLIFFVVIFDPFFLQKQTFFVQRYTNKEYCTVFNTQQINLMFEKKYFDSFSICYANIFYSHFQFLELRSWEIRK